MNFYSILAFTLAALVFFGSVFTATDNTEAFLDYHAALIVFGGTLAVAAISFQLDRIFLMMKIFYARMFRTGKFKYQTTVKEILFIAEKYITNDPNLAKEVENLKDPFLKEGMTILIEDYMDKDSLKSVMETRAKTIYFRYGEDAKKFKALGKFPPAMGLMGAVLGMIALLQTLGQPGAEENVGPAMAIAMVATLYGIAFANLVILPVAENLADGATEIYMKNTIILKGLLLIKENKNKIIMTEELNSHLLPSERIDWKEAFKKSGGSIPDQEAKSA